MSYMLMPLDQYNGRLYTDIEPTDTVIIIDSNLDTIQPIQKLEKMKNYMMLSLQQGQKKEFLQIVSCENIDNKKHITVIRGQNNTTPIRWEQNTYILQNYKTPCNATM